MAHSSRVCIGTLDVRDGALSFLGFLQAPVVEAWSLFWHAHLFLVGQKAQQNNACVMLKGREALKIRQWLRVCRGQASCLQGATQCSSHMLCVLSCAYAEDTRLVVGSLRLRVPSLPCQKAHSYFQNAVYVAFLFIPSFAFRFFTQWLLTFLSSLPL